MMRADALDTDGLASGPWSVPSVASLTASAHFARPSVRSGSGVTFAVATRGYLFVSCATLTKRTKTFSCSICGADGAIALEEPCKDTLMKDTASISALTRSIDPLRSSD